MEFTPSFFAYIKGSVIKETTNKEMPQNNEKSAGEDIVIHILQKYGFLTRRLMQRNLEAYGHKTIDLNKTLKKMQQKKIVQKYTIYTEGTDNTSIFCLTEKYRKLHPDKSSYRYDMTDIPYILEHLSVAQWDIAMLKNKCVRECIYEKDIQTEKRIIHVPALHRFKNPFDKDLHVLALSVSRTGEPEGLRNFLIQINDMKEFLENNSGRYKSPQIVIICESYRQIEDMARMLVRINETAGYYFLYSLDSITSDTDPLSMLYGAEVMENGNVSLNLISLKEEKIWEVAGRLIDKASTTISEAVDRAN